MGDEETWRVEESAKTELQTFVERLMEKTGLSAGSMKVLLDAVAENINPYVSVEDLKTQTIYIVTHVLGGVLNEVKAFTKEEDANKYEEKLCEEAGIPYDAEERRRHEEENEVDADIGKWTVELA